MLASAHNGAIQEGIAPYARRALLISDSYRFIGLIVGQHDHCLKVAAADTKAAYLGFGLGWLQVS
jgi:hypothetical protein